MAVYYINTRGGGSNQGTLTQMLRQDVSRQTLSRVINARAPGDNGQIIKPAPFPVTFDPNRTGPGLTLSGGNLVVSGSASNRSIAAANYSAPSGYWELTVTTTLVDSLVVGFVSGSRSSLNQDLVREEAFGGSGIYYALGLDQGNATEGPGGSGGWGLITNLGTDAPAYAAGDIIGCWLVGDGTARIYVNGQLRFTCTQLPAGDLYPALSTGNNTGLTANFGASAFSIYQPTGSASWDCTQAKKTAVNWSAHSADMQIGGTGNLTASIKGTAAYGDGRPIFASLDLTPTDAQPRYFEVTINATDTTGWSVGVGITNSSYYINTYPGRGGPNGTGGSVRASGDTFGPEGDATYGAISVLAGFSATAVIGVLVLGDAVRYYKNGVFYFEHKLQPGSQYPAVNLTNPSNPDSVTANFGATAFSFMPAGATSWDGTRVSTANAGYLYAISGSFSITGNDAGFDVGANSDAAAALDPSTKDSGVTLSNGNLTMTGGGVANSTIGWNAGKHYIEVHADTFPSGTCEIGVGDRTAFKHLPGNGDNNSAGYYSNGGGGGFGTVSGASWGAGDTIGMAVDTNGASGYVYVWWSKNGTWQNGDPVAGTGGERLTGLLMGGAQPVFPVFYADPSCVLTINFGKTAFAYTPPSGYALTPGYQSGSFAITGYSATLTAHGAAPNLAANSGTFNITGNAAGLAVGLPASSGSFAITGYAAGLGAKLPSNSGTFAYTGNAATLIHIGKLPAGSGTFNITGNAAGMGANLPAVSGAFNITGYSAGMAVGEPTSSGSFAITGYAAGLKVNLPANTGVFAYTGNAATLIRIAKLPAGSGTFAITGNPAGMGANLPALSGAFNITGYAAGMASKEPAASGAFTYTGYAAGFAVGLNVGSGTFAYTGNSATMARGVKLAAGSGAFAITGNPATMGVGLAAGSGSFAITGRAASISVNENLASGTFLFTGYSATYAVQMPAGSGAFNITGRPAANAVQMPLGSGPFTITGYDASLVRTFSGHNLDAGSGSFLITGNPTSLVRTALLSAGAGTFAIGGVDASFGVAINVGSGIFTLTGNAATFSRTAVAHAIAAGSGSFIIAGGDTTWRRYRRKYGTWVQPPVAPPVQVPYETLIRRNDATFRRDGQRLPEYEFTQATFVADPATRGPYEAP